MLVEPSCGATLSAGIKYTHLRSSTLICTRYVLRMICSIIICLQTYQTEISLSSVYTNRLKEYLDQSDKVINGDTHTDINGEAKSPIVVIVCGGATITKEGLDKLIEQFGVDLKLKKQYPLPKWGQ